MNLSIRDRAFGHAAFSNNPSPPVSFSKKVVWNRTEPVSEKTIYTDAEIFNAPDGVIAWLLEPIFGREDAYEFLLGRAPKLREIWTSDRKLLGMIPNGRFVPFGGCWVAPEDRKIWPKSKNTSIIVSRKRGSPAYDLRHEVADKLGASVDAFGIEYTPLEFKIGGLRDYRFQVVIENVNCDWWFTEKLIDCFATGTVPIYLGCPSIGDFFNLNGIVRVDTFDAIQTAVAQCTEGKYRGMKAAVEDNFERAKRFVLAEDWLAEKEPGLLKSLALVGPEFYSEEDRFEYLLSPDSVVLDCGGYKGEWAQRIHDRYGSVIHVFEPVAEFFKATANRLVNTPNVHVYNYGVGAIHRLVEFSLQNDSTGEFSQTTEKEWVSIKGIEDIFTRLTLGDVDLMKVNIEGGEFALLERMVKCGLIKRVKNLQVQWHDLVPDSINRFEVLQNEFAKTHELTFDNGWVWQGWRLK